METKNNNIAQNSSQINNTNMDDTTQNINTIINQTEKNIDLVQQQAQTLEKDKNNKQRKVNNINTSINPIIVPQLYQPNPGQQIQYLIPIEQQAAGPPLAYQIITLPQPVIIQQNQVYEPPKTIIIKENVYKKSDNCCYCRGPKQSPCGCLDNDKDYCCAVVAFSYILMALSYILMGLWIFSCCFRGYFYRGW